MARKSGGTFLLRFDDTDTERSRQEFADGILEDLAWLGIPPDRIERQSDRAARYAAVLEDFKARGWSTRPTKRLRNSTGSASASRRGGFRRSMIARLWPSPKRIAQSS